MIQLCIYYSKRIDFSDLEKELTDFQLIENVNSDVNCDYQSKQELYNGLNESISLFERSAKRLLPIYQELKKRIIQFKEEEQEVDQEVDKSTN